MDPSRRRFLLGRRISRIPEVSCSLRPPWALPEENFLAVCTRCEACVERCPTQIITRDEKGFPKVDFSRGECTFCGDCVKSCTDGALWQEGGLTDKPPLPWKNSGIVVAIISQRCLAQQNVVCRTCGDACTDQAIRFSPQLGGAALPLINTERCTGCGACVATCPAQALSVGVQN